MVSQPFITLCTAGHIDHGKSSIIECLSGKHPDRLPEEIKRSISIELGFGQISLPNGESISFIDVPGHDRFIRTMIAGVHHIQAVLFVIAAPEGIKPQTIEHLQICQILGATQGIVVFSKADLMEDHQWKSLENETQQFFQNSFLKNVKPIRFSCKTNQGKIQILEALQKLTVKNTVQTSSGPFRLWIDRSFTLKGMGTIVTGTALGKEVHLNEFLEVFPIKKSVRIRNIETHGKKILQSKAGTRTAFNLGNISPLETPRGSLLAMPDRIHLSSRLLAKIRLLDSEKDKYSKTLQFYLGTTHVSAKIKGVHQINNDALAVFTLEKKLPLVRGDRFILRDTSPKTIGGGEIIDGHLQYFKPELLQNVSNLHIENQALMFFFENRGFFGLSVLDILPWLSPFYQDENWVLKTLRKDPNYISLDEKQGIFLLHIHWQKWKREILTFMEIEANQKGLSKGELSGYLQKKRYTWIPKRFFGIPNGFWTSLIQYATQKIPLTIQNEKLYLKGPTFSPKQLEMLNAILTQLEFEGLHPCSWKNFSDKLNENAQTIEPLLIHLKSQNKIIKVSPEFYFSEKCISELKSKLKKYFEKKKEIKVSDFKMISGTTRKYAIPLLEYFDRENFTLRVGNKRILRKTN